MAFGVFVFVAAMFGMVINMVAPHVQQLFAPPPECIVKFKKGIEIVDYNKGAGSQLLREAYELTKKPSTTPFNRAYVTYEYGQWLWQDSQYKAALPVLRESIPLCKEAGYPLYAASAMELLADCQHELGQPGDATALCKEALQIRERALGTSHCYVANTLNRLGASYLDAGQPNEASGAFHRAIEIIQAVGDKEPCDSSQTTRYRSSAAVGLAEVYAAEKKLAESEKQLRSAIAYCDERSGSGSSLAEDLLRDYVRCLHKLGYAERAGYYNNKLDNPFVLVSDGSVAEEN